MKDEAIDNITLCTVVYSWCNVVNGLFFNLSTSPRRADRDVAERHLHGHREAVESRSDLRAAEACQAQPLASRTSRSAASEGC